MHNFFIPMVAEGLKTIIVKMLTDSAVFDISTQCEVVSFAKLIDSLSPHVIILVIKSSFTIIGIQSRGSFTPTPPPRTFWQMIWLGLGLGPSLCVPHPPLACLLSLKAWNNLELNPKQAKQGNYEEISTKKENNQYKPGISSGFRLDSEMSN